MSRRATAPTNCGACELPLRWEQIEDRRGGERWLAVCACGMPWVFFPGRPGLRLRDPRRAALLWSRSFQHTRRHPPGTGRATLCSRRLATSGDVELVHHARAAGIRWTTRSAARRGGAGRRRRRHRTMLAPGRARGGDSANVVAGALGSIASMSSEPATSARGTIVMGILGATVAPAGSWASASFALIRGVPDDQRARRHDGRDGEHAPALCGDPAACRHVVPGDCAVDQRQHR